MVVSSIVGLNLDVFEEIHFVLLHEHEERFHFLKGLKENLEDKGLLSKSVFTFLDKETASQPETIVECLRVNNIVGPIFIKDCDNYFSTNVPDEENVVCYCDLNEETETVAANKSYLTIDLKGVIKNIVEKKIISSTFCCGGYGFKLAQQFIKSYEKLSPLGLSLFVSDIVFDLMFHDTFYGVKAGEYQDWGTLKDWDKFKSKFKTIFVDIDGTLLENASSKFPPYIGESLPLTENIDHLKLLKNTQIILTTSRAEKYRAATEKQLLELGLRFDALIMNLYHAKRVVVNDFSKTNPYPSCGSINIERNSTNLKDLL